MKISEAGNRICNQGRYDSRGDDTMNVCLGTIGRDPGEAVGPLINHTRLTVQSWAEFRIIALISFLSITLSSFHTP